jgi:hypothetical protein
VSGPRQRFVAATPTQVIWAGHVWAELFPHDRVALYFLALGIFDPKQQQAKNDWYEIGATARQEIASQMLRLHGQFETARP